MNSTENDETPQHPTESSPEIRGETEHETVVQDIPRPPALTARARVSLSGEHPKLSLSVPVARTGNAGEVSMELRGLRKYLRLFAVVLGLLVMVLVVAMLSALSSMLKPLFVSVFLCYLILPAVKALERHKVPKQPAYLLVILTVVAVLYLFGQLVALNIQDIAQRWPQYRIGLLSYVGELNGFALRYGLIPPGEELNVQNAINLFSGDLIADIIGDSTTVFMDLVKNLVTVMVFMIFLLYEAERFPRRVQLAFSKQSGRQILGVLDNINTNVESYIVLKAIVSFITALVSAGIMAAFSLDFIYFLSLTIFVLNFIPYVGSLLAVIGPTLIALVQFNSPVTAVWLWFVLGFVQFFIGNILEPRLQGQQLNLSPLVLLVSLAFWAWLWGLTGMLLAIPITVSMYIILAQFQSTRPIAVMMSGLDKIPKSRLSTIRKQGVTNVLRAEPSLPDEEADTTTPSEDD